MTKKIPFQIPAAAAVEDAAKVGKRKGFSGEACYAVKQTT
jgi:hypothetical protein